MTKTVHAEYHYRSNTADTIVLLIHGIQGSPLQFDFMIDTLPAFCSVENLLLPGHGGTVKAFNRSSMAQWQSYVDEKVLKAQREYRNIFLVGHSMGSLLSVQAALTHPEQIRGLFLIAMPLVVRISYPYVKNSMTVALKRERPGEDAVITAARRGKSIKAGNPLDYIGGIPRLFELLRKGVATRRLISRLTIPVIVVQSEQDEVVGKKSLRYTEDLPNVRVLTAEASGHYCFSQQAKDRMLGELTRFIRQETVLEPEI